jgi:hypothetical protein
MPLMKLRAKAMSRGRITPRAGAQVAALCRIFNKLLAASRANRRPRDVLIQDIEARAICP